MADDLLTIDPDATAVEAALTALPDALHALTMEACRLTAEAIVAEAQGRLKRQLSAADTGDVEAGITFRVDYTGDGYVVLADDARLPNLPLYLEKGTRPGKRRNFARTPAFPFFYASIELELGAHEQRIADAMTHAAQQTGLGG